ncbi:MAG: hypothetical protein AB9907_09585 [Flexilinea sp.]
MNYQLPITSVVGLVIITISALVILVNKDLNERRFSLFAYICQYVGAVLLLVRIFSLQILFVVFITGLTGGAIIGTDQVEIRGSIHRLSITPSFLFRSLFGFILWVLIFSIEPRVAVWLPVPDSILFASLWMVGMGIAEISLDNDYFSVITGLLSIFFGFELIYMLLEDSSLVFGFLTAINLMIALAGAFILMKPETISDESKDKNTEQLQ